MGFTTVTPLFKNKKLLYQIYSKKTLKYLKQKKSFFSAPLYNKYILAHNVKSQAVTTGMLRQQELEKIGHISFTIDTEVQRKTN